MKHWSFSDNGKSDEDPDGHQEIPKSVEHALVFYNGVLDEYQKNPFPTSTPLDVADDLAKVLAVDSFPNAVIFLAYLSEAAGEKLPVTSSYLKTQAEMYAHFFAGAYFREVDPVPCGAREMGILADIHERRMIVNKDNDDKFLWRDEWLLPCDKIAELDPEGLPKRLTAFCKTAQENLSPTLLEIGVDREVDYAGKYLQKGEADAATPAAWAGVLYDAARLYCEPKSHYMASVLASWTNVVTAWKAADFDAAKEHVLMAKENLDPEISSAAKKIKFRTDKFSWQNSSERASFDI